MPNSIKHMLRKAHGILGCGAWLSVLSCLNPFILRQCAALLAARSGGLQRHSDRLVGWEHSMKNELIIAKYTGQPSKNARERMLAILAEFNLQDLQHRFVK